MRSLLNNILTKNHGQQFCSIHLPYLKLIRKIACKTGKPLTTYNNRYFLFYFRIDTINKH
ncbi:hypothetical protein DA456_03720 [Pseudomonas syringae pv. atrofaciens]|uniref:Uncharacterized protein n=1 Tax=Pseudomonas syringae pv. atrofaciens TaxID=192087 RepID=A0AAD0I774_PSESX|nr:hypothetical protein DA456_03720 [Pseudomonas syringae pv. atrofaciens]OBS37175.1 hypothetical protein A9K79_23520 [Pseudomonas syringae pv. syringae]